MEWIVDWAAEHEGPPPLPSDEAEDAEEIIAAYYAPDLLVRMLNRGDAGYRIASARTLGYIGYLPAMLPLYQSLGDQSDDVRAAAFAALADLQAQVGQGLPGI